MKKQKYEIEIINIHRWLHLNEYEGVVMFQFSGCLYNGYIQMNQERWQKLSIGTFSSEVYFKYLSDYEVQNSTKNQDTTPKKLNTDTEYLLTGKIIEIENKSVILHCDRNYFVDFETNDFEEPLEMGNHISFKAQMKLNLLKQIKPTEIKNEADFQLEVRKIDSISSNPKLPASLGLTIAGNTIALKIWYKDNEKYADLYLEFLNKKLINNKCCLCETGLIKRRFETVLDDVWVVNQYNDTSYYTDYYVYTCNNCNLSWTEFFRKYHETEISFP